MFLQIGIFSEADRYRAPHKAPPPRQLDPITAICDIGHLHTPTTPTPLADVKRIFILIIMYKYMLQFNFKYFVDLLNYLYNQFHVFFFANKLHHKHKIKQSYHGQEMPQYSHIWQCLASPLQSLLIPGIIISSTLP